VQADKIKALREFPKPTNLRGVRAFVGLASYYRAFIPGFSTIAAPLNELSKKGRAFAWGPEQNEAFAHLQQLLTRAPVLEHFRPHDRDLILQTDASKVGIGAVLLQRDPSGEERPVMFISRTLQPAERNYPVREQELLAIVFAAKQFRDLLHGQRFRMETDHESLQFLHSGPLSPRVRRWMLALGQLDFDVVYRPGRANLIADTLSRYPVPAAATPEQQAEAALEASTLDRALTAFRVGAVTTRGQPDPEGDRDIGAGRGFDRLSPSSTAPPPVQAHPELATALPPPVPSPTPSVESGQPQPKRLNQVG
jgi:hypothetical protein